MLGLGGQAEPVAPSAYPAGALVEPIRAAELLLSQAAARAEVGGAGAGKSNSFPPPRSSPHCPPPPAPSASLPPPRRRQASQADATDPGAKADPRRPLKVLRATEKFGMAEKLGALGMPTGPWATDEVAKAEINKWAKDRSVAGGGFSVRWGSSEKAVLSGHYALLRRGLHRSGRPPRPRAAAAKYASADECCSRRSRRETSTNTTKKCINVRPRRSGELMRCQRAARAGAMRVRAATRAAQTHPSRPLLGGAQSCRSARAAATRRTPCALSELQPRSALRTPPLHAHAGGRAQLTRMRRKRRRAARNAAALRVQHHPRMPPIGDAAQQRAAQKRCRANLSIASRVQLQAVV